MKDGAPLNTMKDLFPEDDGTEQDESTRLVELSSIAVGLRSARDQQDHRKGVCAALARRRYRNAS